MMYRFWNKILEPIFLKELPKVIVEIGACQGDNTINLLRYCRKTNAKLHVIDPMPLFSISKWKAEQHIKLLREISLQALPKIRRYDAVLIDGDHNWYTVYNELKVIEKAAQRTGNFPIVILHDIDWPYGRRDMYYMPETIPVEYRKPFSKKGILPGQSKLADSGGINHGFNNALYENGDKNGVLTAVEDFMIDTSLPITFHQVKSGHGLGILVHKNVTRDKYIQHILRNSGF
jgi:hypothetical protein